MSRKISAYGRRYKHQQAQAAAMLEAEIAGKAFMRGLSELQTTAAIHSITGENVTLLATHVGRVGFIVCHAAAACGLSHLPDINILRGTAESLGDVLASPARLEQLRGSIQSGLAAASRMIPRLSVQSLGVADSVFNIMIESGGGLGTSDFERVLAEPAIPKKTPIGAMLAGAASY